MKGYWTAYSYVGQMPDGSWQRFASDKDYEEAYHESNKYLSGNANY